MTRVVNRLSNLLRAVAHLLLYRNVSEMNKSDLSRDGYE